MNVVVAGASGYVGGELLRLVLAHPELELVQATSQRLAGRPLHASHPNLRDLSCLRFTPIDDLAAADVLFLALPHGVAMHRFGELTARAGIVVDLSADFRFTDAEPYRRHFAVEHPCVELARRFVPGLPELHREELRTASLISVPGCMATAAILALHPLAAAGRIAPTAVIVDARTGSSGSGREPTPAGQHAERSGALRVYAPLGHRHDAEIEQACGVRSRMTVTAVEAVRGVQVLVHAQLNHPLSSRDLWQTFRDAYAHEPFVRIVSHRRAIHRWPEPKILSGSNFCDVGFATEEQGRRLVLIAALDNLMKGAAGNAVQCLNIAAGFRETAGLEFAGMHPA
ncbi:MAG: N-acetyl-gamma-glutamyl-phosphate reductase [Actinomycetota bacterium]